MLTSTPAKEIGYLSGGVARAYLQATLVFALFAGGLYLCFRLAVPFITPLVAALILAIVLAPVHQRLERWCRMPAIAAGLTVALGVGAILLPTVFLGVELVEDAAQGAGALRAALESGFLQKTLSAYPRIDAAATWFLDRMNLQNLLGDGASHLTNLSASLVRVSILQIVSFLLTFYVLFYFLRDRRRAIIAVRSFLPFTVDESSILFTRLVDTIHAVIFGTLVTGIIQGVLGGIILAVAGFPAPILWGLALGVVAILPVLGTIMVWLPAAVMVALDGEWLRAAAIAVAFLAIGILDTFIYPALVGSRLRLHAGVTFIAVVGGLIVLGPTGFILGPLCVAVTLAIRDIVRLRMRPAPISSAIRA